MKFQDIEDRLTPSVEILIQLVRRAQNHDIALRHQFIERQEIQIVLPEDRW